MTLKTDAGSTSIEILSDANIYAFNPPYMTLLENLDPERLQLESKKLKKALSKTLCIG
jgi:hypothetical protein